MSGPVLALDSSTAGASVAVGAGGRVLAREVVEAKTGASSLLLPAVDRAVRAAGLSPADLAAVVVGGGPGSFTGLRIAAATAKAIVRARGVPLFAYSGLLATAAVHRSSNRPVCALFDARNREVFAGCWRFGPGPDRSNGSAESIDSADRVGSGDPMAVEEVMAPAPVPIERLIEILRDVDRPLFAGEGAGLHRAELEAAFGAGSIAEAADESPAVGLLWLARAAPGLGRVERPAEWEPDYLRASGAERIAAARGG